MLGHLIYDDESYSKVTEAFLKQDIIANDLIRQFRPNVIYIEGGLFANEDGLWKIPRKIAEEFCASGGALIVADADQNLLYQQKEQYAQASSFFKAFARYGENDSPHPVYASDAMSYWKGYRQILCKPDKMVLSDWLRPIYEGIPAVLAGLPVPLISHESILVSCNRDTTGTLHLDRWVDTIDPSPFGSVAQRGNGFAVFIAGAVSSDVWLEGCPHNTIWLARIGEFLVEQANRDRDRRTSHRRSPHLLFLSHRSVNKQVVRRVASSIKAKGVAVWFDEEQLVPSQSLVEEIDRALEKMSHFVIFWSLDCVDAPWVNRELRAAVSRLIEKQIPLLIIRLDDTPVPTIIADIFRVETGGYSPEEIGARIADAIERLARR